MPSESSEKILAVNKVDIGIAQSNVECRFSSFEQKVEKILCSTQKVEICSSEILLGEASIQGKITIDVVYLTSDNEINSATNAFSFQMRMESSLFEPGLVAVFNSSIIDMVVENNQEDEFRFIATVEVNAHGYVNSEIPVASLGEDCCALKTETEIVSLSQEITHKFNQLYNFDIKEKIKKILKVDVQSICKDVEGGNSYISINGEDLISILYIEDDIEPKLKSFSVTKPFSEEIEVGSAKKESLIDCFLNPITESVTSTFESNDEGAKISISHDINLHCILMEKKQFEVISDVYSLTHSTLVSTNSFTCSCPTRRAYFQNKIDGTVTLSENDQRIDKVLQNTGNTTKVLGFFVQEDEVIIHGLVKTTVIYLNDESGATISAEVEIPYEIKQRLGEISPDATVDITCVVDNVDVVAKRGKDILVEAEIKTYASFSAKQTDAIISSIEIGEELPVKTSSMEIYFVSAGQTLWEVAKDMREDVELLASFNPDLPDIMTGSEKVICYRKRCAEF